MKRILLVLTFLSLMTHDRGASQGFWNDVIANYPLTSTPLRDVSGIQDDAIVHAATISPEGVLCTGEYAVMDYAEGRELPSEVLTPYLRRFDFSRFTVSCQFKVLDRRRQSLLTLSMGYRLIEYELMDHGYVFLCGNNGEKLFAPSSSIEGYPSSAEYQLNHWHLATITYDRGNATFFLDGRLLGSYFFTFLDGYTPAYESQFMTTEYGSGTAFYGYVRNMLVFGRALTPEEEASLYHAFSH